MGAMVPKRWAKRAVTRNAIKRQIYVAGAEVVSALDTFAYVVRLRSAFDRTFFTSATSEALKSAVRLELQQLFATLLSRSRPKASVASAA
jgi:ribonuclease P protein component